MSDDYTSRMIQWIMDQAASGQPQQIPEYDLDPEDWVQDQQRRENLYQDQLRDTFDFANSAAAGPGAFAPGAFDSTSTYTPVEQGGMQALNAYAARPNTLEGIIAAGILGGSTAATEIAKLQAAYDVAKKNGTLEGSVLEQIPMAPPNDLGEILPDWESLGFRMGDIEEAYITEAQGSTSGALFDPTTGEFVGGGNRQYLLDENGQPVLVDVETQMSEAAQRFADQGLSQPNEQFQAADLLDPNWQYQDQAAQQQQQNFYDTAAMLNQLYASLAPEPVNGKTGLSAAPVQYGKGIQQQAGSGAVAGVGGGGMSDPGARYNYEPGPAPVGSGSPIDMALAAGRALPLASGPGVDYARATTGNPSIDAATSLTGWLQNSGLLSGWFGGGGNEGQVGAQAGNQQYGSGGSADPFAGMSPVAQQAAVAANPALQTPTWQDLLRQSMGQAVASSGVGNTGPAGVGGAGAGGGGGVRMVSDLSDIEAPIERGQGQQPQPNPMDVLGLAGFAPSPNTSTRTGPEPSDTMAILNHLIGTSQATTAPSTAGAPPGGYVHNGAIFDAQDRLVGYTSSGGGGTPSSSPGSTTHNGAIFDAQGRLLGYEPGAGQRQQPTADQRLSIMGQQPDQQVRIGAGKQSPPQTKAARRGGSKRARPDTPATRQGWQDFWTASRSAGRSANETYGADYGRAAAAAYLLAQQGITPLSTQQAARRAASGPYGV